MLLSREEAEKKSICMRCEYCKQETVEHPNWTEYIHYCTNSIISIDPVTGDEKYADCKEINCNGECPLYKKVKLSKFEKFLAKLLLHK